MSGLIKIVTPELAARIRDQMHDNGMTLGMCHGCFDILHNGHVHYFREAARQVDVLVASVTASEFINKGAMRPIFSDDARLSVVAALASVDYVVLDRHATAVAAIRQIRPDFFFKGADYKNLSDPRLIKEVEALSLIGGELRITDGLVSDSSSRAADLMLGSGGA